ncbi:MAG: M20 family peptidase [Pseudomonadota bacterium]
MLRNIGLGIAGLLALFIGIILVRTFSYGGPVDGVRQVTLPEPPTVSAQRAAERLGEAIRFQTITLQAGDPMPNRSQPWQDLHAWLAETYPLVHDAMELEMVAGYSLLFRLEGSDPSLDPIVLMAHQDVVPVNIGTEGDWTGPPFAGEIIDGVVYGRGALDDKGSLVAIMEAVEALIADGFAPRRTLYLMFGHDEEVSGGGAQAMFALLEERGIRAEMVLDEGFFVIKDSPLTGQPFGFVGIAEKGYLTLRLTVTAEGGHSSNPPRNSANVRLAKAILALDNEQMEADFSKPPVSDLFQAAAQDMGFASRMALANLWLFRGLVEAQLAGVGDATIRTTTAPTMLAGSIKENVLPQRSVAVVNFRIHPNNTTDEVIAHVERVTADIEGLEVSVNEAGGIGSPASNVSPTDNLAYGVLAAVASRVGEGAPVGPGLVLGATDSRYAGVISDNIYRFVPSFTSMDEVSGFHGTNERLSVENMGRMIEGYAQIILAMDADGQVED